MDKQLFNKLKQAYSSLGLGDDFLKAQAESLASLGFVTEENIDNVVASQKAFLEGVQKTNDTRVTNAVKRANDAAAAKAAEQEKNAADAQAALQKQIDELTKQLKKAPKDDPKEDDFLEKFNSANAPMLESMQKLQEQLKALQDLSKSQQDDLTKLQEEKTALERKQAAAERQAKIIEKAKELQIPQYRIEEGFNISESATDEEIGNYLTRVAGNIKTNSLPTKTPFALAGKEPSKEEASAIANLIVR